jgi:hypothetical protein
MQMEFKVKKVLTRPALKLQETVPVYVKFDGAMYVGKEIKSRTPTDEAKKKEPATLANITDLQTGQLHVLIMNTVLKGVLTEEYPGEGYVGKCFKITKLGRAAGKQYNPFDVVEIEEPEHESAPAPKKK